jgi:catechol 2,3-dioxygenase-like lactoylglutathione lyase family enzyme
MKFTCNLLAVKNIEASKKFYQEVMQQKIVLDFGANVTFEGNFVLQSGFAELVGLDKREVKRNAHNFELYFEENDLDNFIKHLKNYPKIKFLHPVKEYPWGQRVVRFYDPDLHIIEVGESMEFVIRRFIRQGLTVEQTAEVTMHPIELVKRYAELEKNGL